ncbi:MAG: hypothetical protein ACE5R6_06855 [Candidatus Heimdallarchaeota archaeon]
MNSLILNDPALDSLFECGFPLGKIIHIYGRSGTCKSTFALQTTARIGNMGRKAFFIDTAKNFNKKRFSEVVGPDKKILDNVLLVTPKNLWEQTKLIDNIFKLGKNITLICIDTISAFLRPLPILEQERIRYVQLLTYQLAVLSLLCKKNNCSTILINQATFRDFNSKEEVPAVAFLINPYSDLSIHFTIEGERYRGAKIINPSGFGGKRYFYINEKGLLPLNNVK